MERWKINLYSLLVSQICSLMSYGFAIPFIPFYLRELGVTDSVQLNYYVGLSATLPAAAAAIATPLWGIISDRYGRKNMILRAMFFATIILTSMGFVKTIWQFMVLRVCQGVFTGTKAASMSFVSANTPENRISYALGLMTSSNFLGWSIGPMVGGILAEFMGYRLCFVSGGIIMSIGFILVLLLVKEDKNSYGFKLHNKEKSEKDNNSILTPFVILIMLSLLLQRIARTIFTPFLALYVQECLGTMNRAASYTGFINGATSLATAVAAFTIARRGDLDDKFKLTTYLTLISIPIILFAIPITYLPAFAVLFAAFYFFAGGIEPILSSAISQNTPSHKQGVLFGIMATVSNIGAMISPMLGSFVSVKSGLKTILIIIPIFTSIQALFIYLASKKAIQQTK